MSEVPTITELEDMSVEDFKERIIQGVILEIPGLLSKMDDFSAAEIPAFDKFQVLFAFEDAGLVAPNSNGQMNQVMRYINSRMRRYGPTTD
ncbi:hypothetical protein IJH02_01685 [Candidatus Saccharibacteria bacterium]|nr:hypothetical protein [Candidatus Saccharibacteria bacterium]